MTKIAAILVALVMFALPGVAFGQGAGSGADEYTEDIPGGGGNSPSNENGGGSGGGASLPDGTQGALEGQGADGAAAADLAEQTGPGGNGSGGNGGNDAQGGSGSGGSGAEGSGPSAGTDPSSDGSGVGEVVNELAGGSDDGMGILLPIILGSVLVAAVAFVLIRRSGGSAGST